MKVRRKWTVAVLTALLSLLLVFGGTLGVSARAEGKTVEGDSSRIIQWAQSCEWEEDGLAVYAGQWAGGGLRMFFDVSDGKEFNIKFKVPVYEEDSSDYITDGDNFYSKYIVDVIVESFTNSGKAVLRLWGDSGSAVGATNVSARITSGDLHDQTAASRPDEVAEDIWVKGVMRESSEFDISFNTTDFFKSYWGDWDTTGSLLTMSGSVSNGEAVKNTLDATFNPEGNECEAVQVYFRLSAQHSSAYDDDETNCPEHATNALSKVIITEINGQSLASAGGDGVIEDTVAPYIAPVKVRSGAEIYRDRSYTLEVKTSPRESATQPLYCDYDSDVLCYERLSYQVNVTAPSGAKQTFDGLSNIVFTETGTNKISVTATDLAGNTYTTPESEVEVVRGFVLSVTGVPTTGTVGQTIQLPAGSATDSQDNSCPVTISVQDPYTQDVTVTDNAFTPERTGVYIVTYSSQNEDGTQSDTQTFRITVTAASTSGGDGGDSDGGGCGSVIGGSGGMFALCAAVLVGGTAAAVLFVRSRKKR